MITAYGEPLYQIVHTRYADFVPTQSVLGPRR